MSSQNVDLLTSVIKEASAHKLFSLLHSIEGKKDLILDKELICSLDFIANFSQLKACNVEKVFKLEPGNAPGITEKSVYIVKPTIQNTKVVADHINSSRSTESPRKFWIIHVPRKRYTSEIVLEREGVYGYATLLELPLGFLAFDKDLLSLEISDFFEAFYLKGDTTHVHTAAVALVQLFKVCGPIPKVFGQGKCAKMVVDLMNKIMDETDIKPSEVDKVSQLIILDRDIDYVSVLLSQLTYEGMLDDFFSIKSGRIVFPKEVTGKEPIKVVLNSNDVVFEEIRNNYFASVFSFLRNKAKELQAKSSTSSMTIGDIKNFITKEMRKIQAQHTSLSLHIGACEVILKNKSQGNFQERLRVESDILGLQNLKDCIAYTEDVINKQESFTSALRLLCLLSISQDGLLSADYNTLLTQFRQSYGCKYITTFYKLKKLGLLVEQVPIVPPPSIKPSKIAEAATSKATKIAEKVATAVAFPKYNSFRAVTKKFNLIPEEESCDLKNPNDMSYVFGGTYVPLIGRITEQVIVHGSFKHIEEGMKLLSGSTIMNFKADKELGYVLPSNEIISKTVIVYILGGITFAEVAALRLLGKLNGVKILIATTSFISGGSLMKMLSPEDD